MNLKLFQRIFMLMKPWLPAQFSGLFLTILVSITVFAAPLVSKYLIDEVIPSKSVDNLIKGLLIFVAVSTAQPILGFLNTIVFLRLGQNIARSVRYRLYSTMMAAPMPFLDKRKKGKFVSRILSDGRMVSEFVTGFFIQVLRNIVQIIMVVGGMIYLSAKITIFVLVIFGAFLVVFYYFSKKLNNLSRLTRINYDRLCANIFHAFQRINTIKSYGIEKQQLARFNDTLQETFDINLRTGYLSSLLNNASAIVVIGTLTVIYWYGTIGIINGTLTLGTVIALGLYFQLLGGPFAELTSHNIRLQKIIPVFDRIYEYIDLEVEDINIYEDITISGDIKLSNVSFSYENGVSVLNDVTVKIKEKTLIALIGQSGSGKSTVAKLLLGFYKVDRGDIHIGENNISTLAPATLRKSIGYVSQDIDMFNISIWENILIGNPKAKKEDIEKLCRMLNIHDWVMSLPLGYDTIIDESENLSGGEKQRIGIARALIRNPSLLILDEPTSALDQGNEAALNKLLMEIKKICTIILISHKNSTIKDADQIYYLNNGKIKKERLLTNLAGTDFADNHPAFRKINMSV